MKLSKLFRLGSVIMIIMTLTTACSNLLDEPLQNKVLIENTDYTKSENMVLLINGAYADFNALQWETFPTIGVRGDDVDAAGDQFPLLETDAFRYDRNFWLYNSSWLNLYTDILKWHAAMEEIEKYKEAGASAAEANQYIAEIRVLRAFELLQLARLWGDILIPKQSAPDHLLNEDLASFNEVMQHISDQMDLAIPDLPSVHPNQRTDIRGGVTRYAALHVKAIANLEMKNWQAAADATGEIINSGLFQLHSDYYNYWKIPGKLSDESLLELQYSDFGQGTGATTRYLWNFFGPSDWTPAVAGAGGGWGFWEPTVKYIKFMLDRDENTRLVTTVNFTPDGIAEIQSDPNYATLPGYISNVTPSGDQWNNHPRYLFQSGKFYLPSDQLTPGRTTYGENNNFKVLRYAEVLLMHAEALVMGGSSSVMTADQAVNAVRTRAGLTGISGVTLDDVLDEKYAEFATEWGIRWADLIRHERYSELNEGGKSFNSAEDIYLPYPLPQLDLLPQLSEDNG